VRIIAILFVSVFHQLILGVLFIVLNVGHRLVSCERILLGSRSPPSGCFLGPSDASSSWVSPSIKWVFTLCQRLPGLASCRDTSLYLLIGLGPHLLQMWWSSSCMGNSLLQRGSWIVGKAPSPRDRMDWRPLSAPLERCMWNVMTVASGPRLPCRTSLPSLAPLVLGPNGSPTSTGCWRSAR
jgi:hypothetical protein